MVPETPSRLTPASPPSADAYAKSSAEQLAGSDPAAASSKRSAGGAQESHGRAREAAKDCGASEESGRERLKRHRMEVGGRVWIPEKWGQEGLLKDWIDSSVFDRSLVPLLSAREALMVDQCRRTNAASRRIKNPC